MLTRQELNNSIKETVDQMEEGVSYYLSANTWKEIDELYEKNNWTKLNHHEYLVKKEGKLIIWWNTQIIYEEHIRSIDALAATFALAARALTFPDGAFAFADALAFAFSMALIEGNITKYRDTNNLIKYKTTKEEQESKVDEKNYLEVD